MAQLNDLLVLGYTNLLSTVNVFSDILPNVTNTHSLGTSDLKWKTVYASTFYGNFVGTLTGNITGNADTVDSHHASDLFKIYAWNYADNDYDANNTINGTTFVYAVAKHKNTPVTGTLVDFSNKTNSNYRLQIASSYNSYDIRFRNRNGDNSTWLDWVPLLHAYNYANYAVPRNNGNISYTGLTHYYGAGTKPTYYKVTLPASQNGGWTMVTMKFLIRQTYGTESAGTLTINAHHNTTDAWDATLNAYVDGTLTTGIKVYAAGQDSFYIGGCTEWATIALEKMIIGDGATGKDLSGVTIEIVTALPSSYVTATMHYGATASYVESRYVKKAGDTMTGTLSWGGNISSLNFRTGHASYDGVISYQTSGNEAMLFTTKNAVTSFMFVNGEDTISNISASRWTALTPGLQIKNNCVAIGKLIANDSTPTYKLEVAGDIYANGGWVRVSGNQGLYFESHGGGWYMVDATYIRAYNGKMVYSSGRYLSETVPSSWLAGQNANNGAYNVNDYSNDGSYNPWMRAKNTHANVKKYFSFGTLGKQFYWIGSSTDRTENGYDKAMSFSVESGVLYAPIVGGDRIFTGYDSGETNSVSCSNWFRSNGDTGWYNASHGTHIRPNTVSTYGSIRIHGGAKGGYEGIHFGAGKNGMTVMSIDGSHQGLYNEAAGKWIIYYPGSGGSMGVGTSSLTSGYAVTQGSTSMTGILYMNNCTINGVNDLAFADPGAGEGISWAGGNGWQIYESPDDLSNGAGNLQFVHGSTRRITINKDGYVDINARMVVRGNGSSYNEGIRILPASNGWSNVFFSANTTLSDTHDGGWLIGRRGAAGTTGGVGDFTIEEQSSSGANLTIHKDSNGATLYGLMRTTQGFQVQRTSGDGYGLGLYGSSAHNSYGIHMSLTGTYSKHGFVQGDWATYFCFDGATNRGWIFKQAGTNVASISGTGGARFDDTVFSYAYTRSNNKAAFMWDKPGSNYTGIGANGSNDTIQFRACNASGGWVDYKQHWNFYGDLYAYGARFANRGTSTSTSAYSDSAVEIREYNFGGAQTDTWGYAPRLSFHWSGRVAAQIGLASNGNLYINNNAAGSTTFVQIVGMAGFGQGDPSGAYPAGTVYFKYSNT